MSAAKSDRGFPLVGCSLIKIGSPSHSLSREDKMNRDALLQALGETRQLLARPDNQFAWSGWETGTPLYEELTR